MSAIAVTLTVTGIVVMIVANSHYILLYFLGLKEAWLPVICISDSIA